LEFSGKSVLIVDDSIVRGTTSKEIIQMAKDVGARKVIFASCAPPIRYSNVYGIDMPSRNELVAYHRELDQIAHVIGADLVIYQTLPDLIRSVQQFSTTPTAFDCSVFTGEYVTGDIDEKYLAWVEENRAEKAMLVNTVPGVGNAPTTNGINGNHIGSVAVTNQYEEAQSPLSAKLMAEEAMLKREAQVGCSGPMNGADDIVGLHNTFKVGSA